MERVGNRLFRCCCLFDSHVSLSLWAFCNAAPKHAKDLYETVGYGLGINTMEGREQKHRMIEKYSKNSTNQDRWKYVFRHEFIHLVYLRENGFDSQRYCIRPVKYIPDVFVVVLFHCWKGSVLFVIVMA